MQWSIWTFSGEHLTCIWLHTCCTRGRSQTRQTWPNRSDWEIHFVWGTYESKCVKDALRKWKKPSRHNVGFLTTCSPCWQQLWAQPRTFCRSPGKGGSVEVLLYICGWYLAPDIVGMCRSCFRIVVSIDIWKGAGFRIYSLCLCFYSGKPQVQTQPGGYSVFASVTHLLTTSCFARLDNLWSHQRIEMMIGLIEKKVKRWWL